MVPTRRCSPLTHQWIQVTSQGYTSVQWRIPGEVTQKVWLYLAMVSWSHTCTIYQDNDDVSNIIFNYQKCNYTVTTFEWIPDVNWAMVVSKLCGHSNVVMTFNMYSLFNGKVEKIRSVIASWTFSLEYKLSILAFWVPVFRASHHPVQF